MKRLIYSLIIILALCLSLGAVPVYAAASNDENAELFNTGATYQPSGDSDYVNGETTITTPDSIDKSGGVSGVGGEEQNFLPSVDTSTIDTPIGDNSDKEVESGDLVTGGSVDEEAESGDLVTGGSADNFFDELFKTVSEYATEIFSALAFVASLVLAYMYKSGLTPVITNALTNLGTLVGGVRDSVSENERISREVSDALAERLTTAENTISTLTETITSLKDLMKKEEEATGEKKKLSEVLLAQVDMMYSLFISSALPEYQKEAVAERIKAMRERIENECKEANA